MSIGPFIRKISITSFSPLCLHRLFLKFLAFDHFCMNHETSDVLAINECKPLFKHHFGQTLNKFFHLYVESAIIVGAYLDNCVNF